LYHIYTNNKYSSRVEPMDVCLIRTNSLGEKKRWWLVRWCRRDQMDTEDNNGARDGSERTLLCFGEWWNNQISEIGSAYRSAYLIQFPRSYNSFDACPRSTDLSTMCQEPETSDHLELGE
jgi:hypothetical protein